MKRKIARKLVSIMLCIVLFATMFVVPVSTNVKADEVGEDLEYPPPPDEDEPTPPETQKYNLYLSEVGVSSESMYPELIFANTLTNVDLTFTNKGTSSIADAVVEVYEVKYIYIDPEGAEMPSEPYITIETYLSTLSYGGFTPQMGKTQTTSWAPMEIGEYELKLKISYNEFALNVEYEDRVTFVAIDSLLPVIKMTEDWIIDEPVIMDHVTLIVDADITITENGNLTLQDSNLRAGNIDVWGILLLRNANIDLGCTFRGQYHLWVHNFGILLLFGSRIYNQLPQYTYHFYVDGLLISLDWYGQWSMIMHVWGQDFGGIETGGIELRNPVWTSLFQRTIIRECDTIGIGCYGSSPIISPYVLIYYCGSSWGYGKGVYAEGATANPSIQNSWIMYNGRNYLGHGIKLKYDASATIRYNYIYRNRWSGIYCYYSSSAATIQSNYWIYSNNYYGILCWYSSPTIEDNQRIEAHIYGIRCYRGSPSIKNNLIHENYYGILVYRTPSPTIEENTITSNRYIGIYIYYSSPTIQYNDQISYNSYAIPSHNWGGIYGYYSTPLITGNNILSNYGWGIWMRYGAPTNAAIIGTSNTYGPPENTMGRVWQQWRMRVKTVDADGGQVGGADVDVYNCRDPAPVYSGKTPTNGYTPWFTVTEYIIRNGETSKYYYTPHTGYAYKYTFTAGDTIWMDDNKELVLSFTFRRYAVLISSSYGYMEEFWNDMEDMRNILVDKYGYQDDYDSPGFDPTTNDHIALCFATGPDDPKCEDDIVDVPCYKGDINDVFGALGGVMTDDDFLFVWTFDHGGRSGSRAYLCVNDGDIYDDNFAGTVPEPGTGYTYLGQVPSYDRRVVIMQQCHSGGFIDDLSNSRTMIATACRFTESAYRSDKKTVTGGNAPWEWEYGANRIHGEFLFHIQSAFNEAWPTGEPVNSDANGDGVVSIVEAFNYVWNHDSIRVLHGWEHPQYDDNGDGIGNDGPMPNGGDGALGSVTTL